MSEANQKIDNKKAKVNLVQNQGLDAKQSSATVVIKKAIFEIATSNLEEQWILDLGCTFHRTPNKNYFEDFRSFEGGQVLLGNNKSCKVLVSGIVGFKMHDGIEKVLKNVRDVTFREQEMYMAKTYIDLENPSTEQNTIQLEVELHRNSTSINEATMDDNENMAHEEFTQVQEDELQTYQLARDKKRR
nr:uncharacterized protein LOC107419038 [Ziziphus jujuba var. spinosa]